MTKKKNYGLWKDSYLSRKGFTNFWRIPFYKIAVKYLPTNKDAFIIDIGPGYGYFENSFRLQEKYKNLFLLDGNEETVKDLKTKYSNVVHYKIPDKLPFDDSSVDYIFCSHIIEHLYFEQLFKLLKEIDRVLKKEGILVIISPLLNKKFYNDLSHVRPYFPAVFKSYLCSIQTDRSHEMQFGIYSIERLQYQYKAATNIEEGWGSEIKSIDFVIQLVKLLLAKFRIKKYDKVGYLLILKKEKEFALSTKRN